MSNEVIFPYESGRTLYFLTFSASAGTVWNTAGTPALETYNGSNITDYDTALSELGTNSALYQGSMPAAGVGHYYLVVCERSGASPAQTDAKIGIIFIEWTGSAVIIHPANWNTLVMDSSGNVAADVKKWLATTVATPDTVGYPKVTIKSGTGTGEINLSSGIADCNVAQISGDATAADRLEAMMDGIVTGNVNDASATTTSFIVNSGLSSSDDFYNGLVMQITSGTLAGVSRRITDYVGATRTVSFAAAWPSAPANSVTFNILGRIDV